MTKNGYFQANLSRGHDGTGTCLKIQNELLKMLKTACVLEIQAVFFFAQKNDKKEIKEDKKGKNKIVSYT